MALAYYISDYAYNFFSRKAKDAGFVDLNARRMAGMSKYIQSISFLDYKDTRPDSVKEQHRKQLARSTHPAWSIRGGEYKRARLLTLDSDTIDRFIIIGVDLGVIITRPLVNGGRVLKTKEALVSQVLEAIGIGYISYTEDPVNLEAIEVGTVQRMEKIKRVRSTNSKVREENSLSDYFRRSR